MVTPTEPTVVGPGKLERALIWGGFPLLGAGLGWLLTWLVDWLATLEWIPYQGPVKLVASAPETPVTVGGVLLGVAAGAVLVFLAEQDYVFLRVTDDQVTLTRDGKSQTVPKSSVGAVFLDGKRLVLLGHATEELASERGDLRTGPAAAAFVAHGYPWHPDGDPYRDEFRRWVPGTPDLSSAANAVLAARATALEKDDQEDLTELRAELVRLHVVVRDEKKRQYWRRTHAALDGLDDPDAAVAED